MKKLLAALMMAAVLVTSVTACGTGGGTNKSEVSSEASSAVVSLSSTAGSGYSTDNDTKVKQMLEKVTFNGKPLSIPYKASDLGEGFTFREDVSTYENDEGEEFNVTMINYGSDSLCAVNLYKYEADQKMDNYIACTIGYSSLDDEKYKDLVQIDGIDGNSTMADVIEKFGEPTTSEYTDRYVYNYKIDDKVGITFWGTEDDHILLFDICNKPAEWKLLGGVIYAGL